VGILALETAGVLIVGTLSVLVPNVIGRTVWHDYGIDYGFLPLIQPILGLIWLFWPENRRSFFVEGRETGVGGQN